MKPSWGLLACLVLGAGLTAGAEEPARFRFWRDVDRGSSKEEEIVAFPLDSDIYAATRDGFPDVRVLDDAQTEAPYQIEPEVEYQEDRTRQSAHVEDIRLREEASSIEVKLRLPKDYPAAEGFSFSTPQVNYERKVRVFGSDDGATWKPLVTDGIIFDYSRYMDVANRDVALPQNSFRQFRLVLEDVVDEKESPYKELTRTFRGGKEEERKEATRIERRAFRIDRITFFWHVTRQHVQKAKKSEYPLAGLEKQEDAANHETILHVRTRREPLTSFTLQTRSRNFNRRAVVEVPVVRGVTTEWNAIGKATVSNFRFRSVRREQLSVAFPEHRREEYRIVIRNEDNPPLDITGVKGVKAEGNVYRAVFLAQEGKSYRVFYGSETAQSPRYEAATVLATLREKYQPSEARLGKEVENAAFQAEPGLALRNLLNNWFFLGAAICVMVAVLAWGLFRAGRHLEGLPKE
jgi:hypothetical protein